MSDYKYFDEIQELLKKIRETQLEKIAEVSKIFAEKVEGDKIIHVFGIGHLHIIGIEMFVRAGGLANINAMLDDTITSANRARIRKYNGKIKWLGRNCMGSIRN